MEIPEYEKVSILSESLSGVISSQNLTSELNENNSMLDEVDWYWGNISKEEAAKNLAEKRDGSFLVRNSRNPGEYTLTVRKNSLNRLIRIFCFDGKYGLNNPVKFHSVIELIEYYRRHSLAEFNLKLDIKLRFPLSRISKMNSENVIVILNNLSNEIKIKNELFKKLEFEFSLNYIAYNEISTVFESQVLLTELLQEHHNCMKTFIKSGVYPEVIIQNKQVFEILLSAEKSKLSELNMKLDFQRQKYTEYETKLSLLRGELNSLLNQREEYKSWLIENGISHNESNSTISGCDLDEEIYGSNVEALNLLQSSTSQLERRRMESHIGSNFSIDSWLADEHLSRCEAGKKFLEKGSIDGSFIVRTSNTSKCINHLYTLELMFKERVYRIKIFHKLGFYQLEVGPGFQCLEELIEYYRNNSFKEYLHTLDITLKVPML